MGNGISEKRHVRLNGFDQGMFIKGKNRNNPIILFLHGGPGMPEYPLTQKYPVNIEEYFTVCWWEQ
jgi:dipeptidyl aminopeptidase/acylaminoacyl peptidase